MKNLQSAIEKFESKVKGLNLSKDPYQLLELKEKINVYKLHAKFCKENIEEILACDCWSALDDLHSSSKDVHKFIFETYKFNTSWDLGTLHYMSIKDPVETSLYLYFDFFPRFESFIKEYVEWVQGGNVEKINEDTYIEQTTQWIKKFTEEELMKFYVKEYCSDKFNINN